MSRRPARTGIQIVLWLAAAAGALLLGLSAVGVIGSGLTGGGSTPPLTAQEVDARLALPPPPSPVRSAPAAEAPSVVVPAGPAGTVLARCAGGRPSVVSVNPAQGFEASDDSSSGSRVKLEGDDVDVTVTLRCDGAQPVGTVAVDQED